MKVNDILCEIFTKEIIYDVLDEATFDITNPKTPLGQTLRRKGITKIAVEVNGQPQDLEKGDEIRKQGWVKYGRGGTLKGQLYILDQSNGGSGHTNGTENGFYWGIKNQAFKSIKDPYENNKVMVVPSTDGTPEKTLFIKGRAGTNFDKGDNKLSPEVMQILNAISRKI